MKQYDLNDLLQHGTYTVKLQPRRCRCEWCGRYMTMEHDGTDVKVYHCTHCDTYEAKIQQ